MVGYINELVAPGYNFIANQLDAGDNSLTNLLAFPPEGAQVFLWDVQSQTFDFPATFFAESGWDANFDLGVGKGFVVWSDSTWTATFLGEVLLGFSTNFIAGTNKFSLLASKIPQAGELSALLSFPPTEGDNVYLYRTDSQRYSDAYTYLEGFGWLDSSAPVSPSEPAPGVAQAFFVQHPGPDTNWIRFFDIGPVAPTTMLATSSATSPKIRRLSASSKKITLDVSNTHAGSYNVQFSADRLAWTTVATNQTSSTWTGPLLVGTHGYYRLTSPQ